MKISSFEIRLFWRFFIPALLSSLGMAIGEIADCLFIGGTINEDGLFILGAASPAYIVLATLAVGISVGGSIHFSNAVSTGDEHRASSVFWSIMLGNMLIISMVSLLGFVLASPVTILLGCAPTLPLFAQMCDYLRLLFLTAPVYYAQVPLQYFIHSDNAPQLSAIAMVTGTIVDCCVGFVLIVLLRQGVCASVLATTAGAIAMIGVSCTHLLWGKGILKFHSVRLPQPQQIKEAFFTGLASASEYLYQFVVILIFNLSLLHLGGIQAVAIYDVTTNVSKLVGAVLEAGIMAMIPLISTFYGERNQMGLKKSFQISMVIGFLSTALFASMIAFFAQSCCHLFGLTGSSLEQGSLALRFVMSGLIVASLNGTYIAYFQNIGNERCAYVFTALRCMFILLPCGLVLASGGYNCFWLCYPLTELLVFFGIFLRNHFHGKHSTPDNVFSNCVVFSETIEGTSEIISGLCERIQRFLEENGADARKAYPGYP